MPRNFIVPFSLLALILCHCTHTATQTPQAVTETIILSDIVNERSLVDLGNGWYETIGRVEILSNMSKAEAEKQALEQACVNAIQHYSGVQIQASSVAVTGELGQKNIIDAFTSVSKQTTRGVVLEKTILANDIRVFDHKMFKVVKLKVRVGRQLGEPDLFFKLDARLNRNYFQPGDELVIETRTTKDCYLTILNISSNYSVYILIPNNYHRDNFLKAGEAFTFPDKQDREGGLKLKVALLDGKSEDTEMIKILATKQPLQLLEHNDLSAWGSGALALNYLQHRLLELPASEVTEIDLPYVISR